jgi:CrcB protein
LARLLYICVGGAIGTGGRYLLSGLALRLLGPGFPFGTLAVNVIGSFLIGLIMFAGIHTQLLSPGVRLFLTTGIMGGFTTYSSFNYETFRLFQDRAWLLGGANVAATFLGCFIAGILGWGAGRLLFLR